MNPEIAQYEALAKEILRRVMAEEEADDLFKFVSETLARLGAGDDTALLSWEDSFTLVNEIIEDYERLAQIPESERKVLSWPWNSWNKRIDPLEPGMLGVIAAPDGVGKTIIVESIAEHWAKQKNKIVFVHYELNRKLMMLRRTSRHSLLTTTQIKSGELTQDQKNKIAMIEPRLREWEGQISYLHTPGWSMEKTLAELRKLVADQECDAVIIDYLEKVAPSKKQIQLFGAQHNQREANNVELLKNFSEATEVPVMMVAQMNKAGKSTEFSKVDRTAMRGAGEKSEKANLVILATRERTNDGYSDIVNMLVDKNTMGATGTFQQVMKAEYFTIADIAY